MARERIAPIATQVLQRAQDAGVVRADLGAFDVPMMHFAVGFVAERTRGSPRATGSACSPSCSTASRRRSGHADARRAARAGRVRGRYDAVTGCSALSARYSPISVAEANSGGASARSAARLERLERVEAAEHLPAPRRRRAGSHAVLEPDGRVVDPRADGSGELLEDGARERLVLVAAPAGVDAEARRRFWSWSCIGWTRGSSRLVLIRAWTVARLSAVRDRPSRAYLNTVTRHAARLRASSVRHERVGASDLRRPTRRAARRVGWPPSDADERTRRVQHRVARLGGEDACRATTSGLAAHPRRTSRRRHDRAPVPPPGPTGSLATAVARARGARSRNAACSSSRSPAAASETDGLRGVPRASWADRLRRARLPGRSRRAARRSRSARSPGASRSSWLDEVTSHLVFPRARAPETRQRLEASPAGRSRRSRRSTRRRAVAREDPAVNAFRLVDADRAARPPRGPRRAGRAASPLGCSTASPSRSRTCC